MSVFTEAEIAYLQSQRLGRLATVDERGDPHVMPVGFSYNADLDTIDIGGRNMGQSKKFRDIAKNGRAAFVVDDVLPPWKPRYLEIRGPAEALAAGEVEMGPGYSGEIIRIRARRIISGGIETDSYIPSRRSVEYPS